MASQSISDKHKGAFWRDGVIVLRRHVDDEWLQVIAQAIEADITSPGPYFRGHEPKMGVDAFMETFAPGSTTKDFGDSAWTLSCLNSPDKYSDRNESISSTTSFPSRSPVPATERAGITISATGPSTVAKCSPFGLHSTIPT